MAIRVDADREHDDGVDHASALADLHRRRVGRQEGERPSLSQRAAELVDMLVQLAGHAADLGLRQPVDVQGLDELVHAASGHAGGVASLRPR